MRSALDPLAIRVGALTCIAIATPAAITQAILADTDAGTDQSNWVFLALLAIVAAYLVGGARAGKRALDAPFLNGAAATFIAWATVQTVALIVKVAQGESFSALSLPFNALLAASIGVVGAWFGARRGTIENGGGEPTG